MYLDPEGSQKLKILDFSWLDRGVISVVLKNSRAGRFYVPYVLLLIATNDVLSFENDSFCVGQKLMF